MAYLDELAEAKSNYKPKVRNKQLEEIALQELAEEHSREILSSIKRDLSDKPNKRFFKGKIWIVRGYESIYLIPIPDKDNAESKLRAKYPGVEFVKGELYHFDLAYETVFGGMYVTRTGRKLASLIEEVFEREHMRVKVSAKIRKDEDYDKNLIYKWRCRL